MPNLNTLSPATRRTLAATGLLLLLLTAVGFLLAVRLEEWVSPHATLGPLRFSASVFDFRTTLLQWGVATGVAMLYPFLAARRFWTPGPLTTAAVVTAVAALIVAFVLIYGNQQFGAWDFGVVLDTGWRELLKQRPYTDFPTTTPPFFNLGVGWAFHLLGATWKAQLWAIGLLGAAALLWMFLQLRSFGSGPAAALFLAFSVVAVTVLSVCFWWYNDTTQVCAALFFLSCAVCLVRSDQGRLREGAWWSYTVTLGMFGLTKPNTAGLLGVVGFLAVVFGVRERGRVVLQTVAAVLLALLMLELNHVSVPDMLSSYRAAAVERGGFSHFGIATMSHRARITLLLWTLLLAAPLWGIAAELLRTWRRMVASRRALLLLLLFSLPLTLYGMATNAEVKESEAAVLVLAGGLYCLVWRRGGVVLQALFAGLVSAAVCSMVFFGAARERARGVGYGAFYEYEANVPITDRVFDDLRGTPHMAAVIAEAQQAVSGAPGPVFIGPRAEFLYPVLGVTPPREWPGFFDPGTSFARAQMPLMVQSWQRHQFGTLVFLHGDRSYWPAALLETVEREYRYVPGYAAVDVYERRSR